MRCFDSPRGVVVNLKRVNIREDTIKMIPHASLEQELPGEGTGRK